MEDHIKNASGIQENENHDADNFRAGSAETQNTIKIGDDLNSNEVLVFTSYCNVYKVPKKEIYTIRQALEKTELEPGEKPIYVTGDKNYSGFLIVAFENGKIGKITMSSFSTEYQRKKLRNAFNNESKLIFIERIDNDIDLVTESNIKKVVLFNTSLINPVGSRTTKGVQAMKQKDGSHMMKVKRADHVKLTDPEYYRKNEGLNVVGYYLKKEDEV
jgi:DNA gyrase/topoisomerase IV subunit A